MYLNSLLWIVLNSSQTFLAVTPWNTPISRKFLGFLDGGHAYETVKNDLNYSRAVLENNGTILCDDYNLSYAPGVKRAIDEFVSINKFSIEILFNHRFAKIEKNKSL